MRERYGSRARMRAHLLRRAAAGERHERLPALGDRVLDRPREPLRRRPRQRRPVRDDDHLATWTEVDGRVNALPVSRRNGPGLGRGIGASAGHGRRGRRALPDSSLPTSAFRLPTRLVHRGLVP